MGGQGKQSMWRGAGLALSGCAALILLSCSSDRDSSGDKASAAAPLPVVLHQVGAARSGVIKASGTVRLRRETPFAFLADGRVRSVAVREGDRVRSGQLLASLDRTAIDASAVSADARARQATADLSRQRILLEQGWISKARVEAAEAAARAADADRTAARFTQRFSTIAAPADGVVLARLAEPGQMLSAGTPVLLVGEFASGFVLRVPLSAAAVAGLAEGAPAQVVFRDGAASPMAARVIEIAGRAEPRTGTFQVELALPADPALRSGLIADVELPAARSAAPLMVPASAVFSARADEGFVWRYDPAAGEVVAALVTIGAVSDQGIEVFSGLAQGDLIVGAGVDRLIEGQRVKPVRPAEFVRSREAGSGR